MTSENNTQSTRSSLLERFERLKAKRRETIKLNKIDVASELRRQKHSGTQADPGSNSDQHHPPDDKHGLSDAQRAMEYTIEECEKWAQRQKRAKAGPLDFNKLAEASYYKEIANIKIDKAAYQLQKDGNEAETSGENGSNGESADNYNKPTREAKRGLSLAVKESRDRKYNKKRRGRQDELQQVDAFINERNKQFNLKLNRQYQGKE
ncbi:uncharacterized protein LODBEIA_P60670 [Lodderomyces beijingensis]|uniref:Pre-mRNA-splicing factor SYF2 n=1 Tax=Lodderomyces beijingensis TaxID=1775926 RepID=A0ABP0ZUN7_9ASCO